MRGRVRRPPSGFGRDLPYTERPEAARTRPLRRRTTGVDRRPPSPVRTKRLKVHIGSVAFVRDNPRILLDDKLISCYHSLLSARSSSREFDAITIELTRIPGEDR